MMTTMMKQMNDSIDASALRSTAPAPCAPCLWKIAMAIGLRNEMTVYDNSISQHAQSET